MGKKSKRWRSIRLQIKREKVRLYKQTKPTRDTGHSGYDMVHDKPGFNLFAWLSRPAKEKEKKVDRRKPNGRQEDR